MLRAFYGVLVFSAAAAFGGDQFFSGDYAPLAQPTHTATLQVHLDYADEAQAGEEWMRRAEVGQRQVFNDWEMLVGVNGDFDVEMLSAAREEVSDYIEARFIEWSVARFFEANGGLDLSNFLDEVAETNLMLLYETDTDGSIRYDSAGAPVMQRTEGLVSDRSEWNVRVADAVDREVGAWEQQYDQRLIAMRAGVSSTARMDIGLQSYESAALARSFEIADERVTQQLRRELEAVMRLEQQRFVARRTRDRWSLRRESEQSTANELTAQLIAETEIELNESLVVLEDTLNAALIGENPGEPNESNSELDKEGWSERFREQFDSGMRRWEQAEARLLSERVEWERNAGLTLEEGERVWSRAYRQLRERRAEWRRELRTVIEQGRRRWADEHESLEAAIAESQRELEEVIQQRRTSAESRIDNLVEMYVASRDTMRTTLRSVEHWMDRLEYPEAVPEHIADPSAVERLLQEELSGTFEEVRAFRLGRAQKAVSDAESALDNWRPEAQYPWERVNTDEDPPADLTHRVEQAREELLRTEHGIEFASWVVNAQFDLNAFRNVLRYDGHEIIGIDRSFVEGLYGQWEQRNQAAGMPEPDLIAETVSTLPSSRAPGQLLFWMDTWERYKRQSEQAMQDLMSTYGVVIAGNPEVPGADSFAFDEILEQDGAESLYLDGYQVELLKSRAHEQYWEHQLEIARSVYEYAIDESSNRATEAETRASYREALADFESAMEDYEITASALSSAGGDLADRREDLESRVLALESEREHLARARDEYRAIMDMHLTENHDFYEEQITQYFEELATIWGLNGTDNVDERQALAEYRRARAEYDAELGYAYAWRRIEQVVEELNGVAGDVGSGNSGVAQRAEDAETWEFAEGPDLFRQSLYGRSTNEANSTTDDPAPPSGEIQGFLGLQIADYTADREPLNDAAQLIALHDEYLDARIDRPVEAELARETIEAIAGRHIAFAINAREDLEARLRLLTTDSTETWLERGLHSTDSAGSESNYNGHPDRELAESFYEIERRLRSAERAAEVEWLMRRVQRERNAIATLHQWYDGEGGSSRVDQLPHVGLSDRASLTLARAWWHENREVSADDIGLLETAEEALFEMQSALEHAEEQHEQDLPVAELVREVVASHDYAAEFLGGRSLFAVSGDDLSRTIAEGDRRRLRSIQAMQRAFNRERDYAPGLFPLRFEQSLSQLIGALESRSLTTTSASESATDSIQLLYPTDLMNRLAGFTVSELVYWRLSIEDDIAVNARGLDNVLVEEIHGWLDDAVSLAVTDRVPAADEAYYTDRANAASVNRERIDNLMRDHSVTRDMLQNTRLSATTKVTSALEWWLTGEEFVEGPDDVAQVLIDSVAAAVAVDLHTHLNSREMTETDHIAEIRLFVEDQVRSRLNALGGTRSASRYQAEIVDESIARHNRALLTARIPSGIEWNALPAEQRDVLTFRQWDVIPPEGFVEPFASLDVPAARLLNDFWHWADFSPESPLPGDELVQEWLNERFGEDEPEEIGEEYDSSEFELASALAHALSGVESADVSNPSTPAEQTQGPAARRVAELLGIHDAAVTVQQLTRLNEDVGAPYVRALNAGLAVSLYDYAVDGADSPPDGEAISYNHTVFDESEESGNGWPHEWLATITGVQGISGLTDNLGQLTENTRVQYIYSANELAKGYRAILDGRSGTASEDIAHEGLAATRAVQELSAGYASWLDGTPAQFAHDVSDDLAGALEVSAAAAGYAETGGYVHGIADTMHVAEVLEFEQLAQSVRAQSAVSVLQRQMETHAARLHDDYRFASYLHERFNTLASDARRYESNMFNARFYLTTGYVPEDHEQQWEIVTSSFDQPRGAEGSRYSLATHVRQDDWIGHERVDRLNAFARSSAYVRSMISEARQVNEAAMSGARIRGRAGDRFLTGFESLRDPAAEASTFEQAKSALAEIGSLPVVHSGTERSARETRDVVDRLRTRVEHIRRQIVHTGERIRSARDGAETALDAALEPVELDIHDSESQIELLDEELSRAIGRFDRANEDYSAIGERLARRSESVDLARIRLRRAEAILEFASTGYIGSELTHTNESDNLAGTDAVDPAGRLEAARRRHTNARTARIVLESLHDDDRTGPLDLDADTYPELADYQNGFLEYRRRYEDMLTVNALEALLGDAVVRQQEVVGERLAEANEIIEKVFVPGSESFESEWTEYIALIGVGGDGGQDGQDEHDEEGGYARFSLSLRGESTEEIEDYFSSEDERNSEFEHDRHEWMHEFDSFIRARGSGAITEWALALYYRDLSLLEALDRHLGGEPSQREMRDLYNRRYMRTDEDTGVSSLAPGAPDFGEFRYEHTAPWREARAVIREHLDVRPETTLDENSGTLSRLSELMSARVDRPDEMFDNAVDEFLGGSLVRGSIDYESYIRTESRKAYRSVMADSDSRQLFEFYASIQMLGGTDSQQPAYGAFEDTGEAETAQYIIEKLGDLRGRNSRRAATATALGAQFTAMGLAMLPWPPAYAMFAVAAGHFSVAGVSAYNARRAGDWRSEVSKKSSRARRSAVRGRNALAGRSSDYVRAFSRLQQERERLAVLRGVESGERRDRPMTAAELEESMLLAAEVNDVELGEYLGNRQFGAGSGELSNVFRRYTDLLNSRNTRASSDFISALRDELDTGVVQAREALDAEVSIMRRNQNNARTAYRRFAAELMGHDMSVEEYEELDRLLQEAFGDRTFVQREHERALLNTHQQAYDRFDTIAHTRLPSFDRREVERVKEDLLTMFDGRYDRYLSVKQDQFNAHRMDLANRMDEWERTVGAIGERSERQWANSERLLNTRRSEWITDLNAAFARGTEEWNARHLSLREQQADWVRASAVAAAETGSRSVLESVGSSAQEAIAGVEGMHIPGLGSQSVQPQDARVEELVTEALGGFDFASLLDRSRTMNRAISRGQPNIITSIGADTFVEGEILHRIRASRTADSEAIAQAVSLIRAEQARERVAEVAEELGQEIDSANEAVMHSSERTFRDAGWNIRGDRFTRETVVGDTLTSGVVRERHRVRRYRRFDDYDFGLDTDLSLETLTRMSSHGISAQIDAAVQELQAELETVFGDVHSEAIVVATAGEDTKEVDIERGWFSSKFDIGEGSLTVERHADAVLGPGKFGAHVGYAPQLTPNIDFDKTWRNNVLFPGTGQMHRLMGEFAFYEAMQERGYAELNAGLHNTPIWKGEYSPTIRAVAELGASVAATVASGGLASAAITAGNSLLWDAADVASGDGSVENALLGLAQSAALSGIGAGSSIVGERFGGAVGSALDSVAVETGLEQTTQAVLSNTGAAAINAVHLGDSGGPGFSTEAFLEGSLGRQALARYTGSALGGALQGGIQESASIDLMDFDLADDLAGLELGVERIAELGGGLVDQAARYGLGGQATTNFLNLEDIGRGLSALGIESQLLRDETGAYHRHGLLEVGFGRNTAGHSYVAPGSGGVNLSGSQIRKAGGQAANFRRADLVQQDVQDSAARRDWMFDQRVVIDRGVLNFDRKSELAASLRADLETTRSSLSKSNLLDQAQLRAEQQGSAGFRYVGDSRVRDHHLSDQLRLARNQGDMSQQTFLENASRFNVQEGAAWGLQLYFGGHTSADYLMASGLGTAGRESRGSETFEMRTSLFQNFLQDELRVAGQLLGGQVFSGNAYIEDTIARNRMETIEPVVQTVADSHRVLEDAAGQLADLQTSLHGESGLLGRGRVPDASLRHEIGEINRNVLDSEVGLFPEVITGLLNTGAFDDYSAPSAEQNDMPAVQNWDSPSGERVFAPVADFGGSGVRLTSDYALRARWHEDASGEHRFSLLGRHNALDFSLRGDPVGRLFAHRRGEVDLEWDETNVHGLAVVVDTGSQERHIYSHSSPETLYDVGRAIIGAGGDRVAAGTVIGRSQSGTSTGFGPAHLDFSVRRNIPENESSFRSGFPVDPMNEHLTGLRTAPRNISEGNYVEIANRDYPHAEDRARALVDELDRRINRGRPRPHESIVHAARVLDRRYQLEAQQYYEDLFEVSGQRLW